MMMHFFDGMDDDALLGEKNDMAPLQGKPV
jgi:hypothetical protein